jgi:hypothetical protein
MPTAREDIDVQGTSVEIQIEFQLWCETCGNGICGNTNYKKRSTNEFTTFCEVCLKEMTDAFERVTSLENEIDYLKVIIEELEGGE